LTTLSCHGRQARPKDKPAIDFAARAKRARDEGERARLLAVTAIYREMAIAEALPLVMAMPKRPAAPSARRRDAARQRAWATRHCDLASSSFSANPCLALRNGSDALR
jgi:hypothetical protein